jgi:hypothetical protein
LTTVTDQAGKPDRSTEGGSAWMMITFVVKLRKLI